MVHRPGPFQQRLFELGQVEIEMLRLASLQCGSGIEARVGRDQVFGLEQPAAVLALVATRSSVLTVRALAFDVGVGQKALRDRIVETDRPILVEQALVEQHHELVLDHFTMVVSGGGRVQVVADAEITPVSQELGVVARGDLGGRCALLIGAHRDWRAVRVGARDH